MDDFGRLIEEFLLLFSLFIFILLEKDLPSSVPSVRSLHKSASVNYFLKVPFDFEHSPIFLDVNGRALFLFAVLLGLATVDLELSKEGKVLYIIME